mgnify:FL=1
MIDTARAILEMANEDSKLFMLPTDVIAAEYPEEGVAKETLSADTIPENMKGLDIGPDTVKRFNKQIATAGTIVWNGPMGLFEIPDFASGTYEVARAIAESKAISVVGGGDSASAVKKAGVSSSIDHISTGGGASLEYLEGKELPGVAVLPLVD